jgi:hypothetical protein
MERVKNYLQGKVPRYFGHGHGLRMTGQDPSGGGTALGMTGPVVVLSNAKDLGLFKGHLAQILRPQAGLQNDKPETGPQDDCLQKR